MEAITDLFIQNTSGLPYVARCYGGEYCQRHPEHALLTGFFSAINSFSKELNQEQLKNVEFDELILHFSNEDNLLLVIGINPGLSPEEISKIEDIGADIIVKFKEKYKYNDKYTYPETDREFINWLDEKITKEAMGDLIGKVQKPSFWQRLKLLFR